MSERILIIPKVNGIGGMVSFKNKFTSGARKVGVEIIDEFDHEPISAVLVIGGTKEIWRLVKLRSKGVKITQRLDGINWIHKIRPTGLKHKLRAEYGNFILAFIRRWIANEIIYQSEFSRWWWNERYGVLEKPSVVIHNGVDTADYVPMDREENRPLKLLVVEGSMGGGYEGGLANAVKLCDGLNAAGFNIVLEVVGEVSESLKDHWNAKAGRPISWRGILPRNEIPIEMARADLYFSADVHPACPNAVIEALSCGLPVAAFDTGSLDELVPQTCGAVAPYGTDPWKLEEPDILGLVSRASEVLQDLPTFRASTREWALEYYSLDDMVSKYLKVLLGEHDQKTRL